ncbi:MAG: SGNH/GDSL hydrolase family protein [Eubacteriales bacterium]|nr:SGNH/GDSL hydrolase family protein [Eubacteriales bacterium]
MWNGRAVLLLAVLLLWAVPARVQAAPAGANGQQSRQQSGQQPVTKTASAAFVLQETQVWAAPGADPAGGEETETARPLGILAAGQTVNVCGRTADGWLRIVFGNGLGYVRAEGLQELFVDEAMRAALAAQAELAEQQSRAQEAELAAQQSKAQEAALAVQQAGSPAPAAGAGNVIFVGDSRTGQMANAVGGSAAWPGTAFAYCFGGGVDWLSGAAAKAEIDRYVTPGSVIILNYGVNDLSRHNDYIEVINRYAGDWQEKGASVWFASVGPVGENAYGKRNWAVEYFNNQLNGRLNGQIGRIDLYGYLTASGYATTADGLHYTPEVYAGMFRFLMQSVGRA